MNKNTETELSDNSYFKFSAFGLKNLASNSLYNIRAKIYERFIQSFILNENSSILDVGVSLDDHESSNFLEKKYPYTNRITAVGMGDYSVLEKTYPGLKYVKADGRNLPFPDNSFDIIFSHAVIEHVGNSYNQKKFISELYRVCKNGVFFTTPNRSHPVEFHTGFPLIHYFPLSFSRRIYRLLGKEFYSTEENLCLLYKADIKKILDEMQIQNFEITDLRWLGFSSNIIVTIKKIK
jgi:predicted SAM-dependent methyltransferase